METKTIENVSSAVVMSYLGPEYKKKRTPWETIHQRLIDNYENLFGSEIVVSHNGKLEDLTGVVDENSLVTVAVSAHGMIDGNGKYYLRGYGGIIFTDDLYQLPIFQKFLDKDAALLFLIDSCYSNAARNNLPNGATLFASDGKGKPSTHNIINPFVNGLLLNAYVFEEGLDTKRLNEYFLRIRKEHEWEMFDQSTTYAGRDIKVALPQRDLEERFNLFFDNRLWDGKFYRERMDQWLGLPVEMKQRIMKLLRDRRGEVLDNDILIVTDLFQKVVQAGKIMYDEPEVRLENADKVLSRLESAPCNEWINIHEFG